jgi:hypothetical protein
MCRRLLCTITNTFAQSLKAHVNITGRNWSEQLRNVDVNLLNLPNFPTQWNACNLYLVNTVNVIVSSKPAYASNAHDAIKNAFRQMFGNIFSASRIELQDTTETAWISRFQETKWFIESPHHGLQREVERISTRNLSLTGFFVETSALYWFFCLILWSFCNAVDCLPLSICGDWLGLMNSCRGSGIINMLLRSFVKGRFIHELQEIERSETLKHFWRKLLNKCFEVPTDFSWGSQQDSFLY